VYGAIVKSNTSVLKESVLHPTISSQSINNNTCKHFKIPEAIFKIILSIFHLEMDRALIFGEISLATSQRTWLYWCNTSDLSSLSMKGYAYRWIIGFLWVSKGKIERPVKFMPGHLNIYTFNFLADLFLLLWFTRAGVSSGLPNKWNYQFTSLAPSRPGPHPAYFFANLT